MAQLCVTDEAKDDLRQKKKELADLRGHEVSDTDTLLWLCESQPKSKGDRLRTSFDKFKQEITILVSSGPDQKSLCELLEIFSYILQKSIEQPKRIKAYGEGARINVDAVQEKFSPSAMPIKKRIEDATSDGSAMDKQG